MAVRNFLKTVNLLGVIGTLTMALTLPASAAVTPQLYFSQPTVTVQKGADTTLALHINPNGAAIDTVNVVVNYPASQLEYDGMNKSGATFDTFIPAQPAAKNGVLTFAAASLGQKVTTDSLIATLSFKPLVSSGSATVSLSGSKAANDGSTISATTAQATVNFKGAASSTNGLRVNNVSVSDISTTGAVLHWQTNVASTGSVDYGTDTRYGLTASDNSMGTSHSVSLKSAFRGSNIVHYIITATDTAGDVLTTKDATFTTKGYTVKLTITNAHHSPLQGASVTVAGNLQGKTDANGTVTIQNVAPGTQSVVINGAPAQFITVKAVGGAAAGNTQTFTLTAKHRSFIGYIAMAALLAVLAMVVIEGLLIIARRRRAAKTASV